MVNRPSPTSASSPPVSTRGREIARDSPRSLFTTVPLSVQLMLTVVGVLLAAALLALLLLIGGARERVQSEVNSSMTLIHRSMVRAMMQDGRHEEDEDYIRVIRLARQLRHVRVKVQNRRARPASKLRRPEQQPQVPAWFMSLMPVEDITEPRFELNGGPPFGKIEIVPDPRDEVLEIWHDVKELAILGGGLFIVIALLVYIGVTRGLRPLKHLHEGFERLSQGDSEVRVSEDVVPELAHINRHFNHMAEVLSQATRERQRLARRLVSLQEQERRAIARELHDDMSTSLFGIRADLAGLDELMRNGRCEEVSERILSADTTVAQIQQAVRALLQSLRPPAIDDDVTLEEALDGLLLTWRTRNSETRYELTVTGLDDDLDDTIKVTVYRIVQEGLANAARHSRGEHVYVDVRAEPATDGDEQIGDRLEITVADDGQGMKADVPFGHGLTGILERAHALGGSLALQPRDAGGLSVQVIIPLAPDVTAD